MAVNRRSRASIAPTERLRAPAGPGLTRAEERALHRSTPLTPAQFKALRQRAEQGISPLRRI